MIFPQSVIPYDNYVVKYEAMIGKLRRSLGLRDVVESRGYTGATLVRKQAVKRIRMPAVGRQEDYYIKKYCEHQNWKVKYASDIVVLHFNRHLPSYQIQYLEGYGMAMIKSVSRNRMLIAWFLTYPKSLITLPYVRNLNLLRDVPKMYYIKYRGYIDAVHQRLGGKQCTQGPKGGGITDFRRYYNLS
jgi:hypothetical protein